jgi:cell division protein FtsW (lipid II flippase)
VLALILIYLQKDLGQLILLRHTMLVLTIASGLHYIYRGIRAYHPDLV